MTAIWQKNEPTAAKRRCMMQISVDGGYLCGPGIDFIALGAVFVVGVNAPNADLATGTLTNVRRPLVVADDTFTADNTTEIFTAVAHGLKTGDGPIRVSNSGGALPSGLAAATDYYVIKIDADTFKLATSLANAYSGTNLSITTDGTGTQTLSDTASTERGISGYYVYEATQAETNHDAQETSIFVDATGYDRGEAGGAHTSIGMSSEAASVWDLEMENGQTYGDGMRINTRSAAANFSDSGSVRTFRDLADTKNSHHGTITASGRSSTVIDDAT